MNSHAYRYEVINNEKGMFDNYVDMAYILTLENSKRKNVYMNQIEKYKPHKTITIQYDKGFKLCKKQLQKQDSINDINDSYYHIFLNALQKNYKNIIIFEDDFFFDDTINQYIVDDIGNFIKNNPYHVYNLGPIFHISIPNLISPCHIKSYLSTAAHASIYSRDYAYHFIKIYEKGFTMQCDLIWNDLSIIKYSYYKQLCFQLFEQTPNRENWFLSKYLIQLHSLLKLDKYHQPGYKLLNIVSFIISFHLIYLFLRFYL
jgi:hypothetical protein